MRVLIIGLGSIGRKHVRALQQIDPGVELYALRSQQNADAVAGVNNIHALAELPNPVDFVIIANNTQAHGQTIKTVLDLGCPLFIEKPVLSGLEGATELQQAIAAAGIPTYVACNLRFHPALLAVAAYVAQQPIRINEVNIYCGSYLPEWRPGRDFRTVYSANSDMGGGVHLDLVHELDYCTWLFGFPQQVHAFRYQRSSLRIHAPDSAHYHLAYEGFPCNVTLNYFRRDSRRTLEIVAEDRTLLVDIRGNSVTELVQGKTLHQGPAYDFFETYTAQLRYFIAHIQSGEPMMNDFGYALRVLNMALYA